MKFLIVVFLCILLANAVKEIPDKFLGKWDLGRSENFNEYLSARGVGWFVRKMISMASVSKTFEKGSAPNTYTYYSNSTKENVAYQNFKLGEEFKGKGFDGLDHLITFDMPDSDTLTEKHIRTSNAEDKGITYKYKVENGELVLILQHDDITARRYFSRI